jgi:predicted metalloprotease with PDZ domain
MGAIAMSSAQNTHDKCVSDMERIGYVRLPEVKIGIMVSFDTQPFVIKEVVAPAADAGVKAGDRFRAIDGQAITSAYQMLTFLNKKHAGDEIKIEVLRDEEVKVMPVILISH